MLGLLHDATESYIGDMVRPLKLQMPEFNSVEDALWSVIAEKFGLPVMLPPEIKLADNAALMAERRDLFDPVHIAAHDWSIRVAPLPDQVIPLCPDEAKKLFLDEFYLIKNNANP
jgi:hypothetical protein